MYYYRKEVIKTIIITRLPTYYCKMHAKRGGCIVFRMRNESQGSLNPDY